MTKQKQRHIPFLPPKGIGLKSPYSNPKAEHYLQRKIKANLKEGYPKDQAIAIAFSQTRAKGYNLPRGIQSMEKSK
jgi:hypothetical protein